MILWEFKETAGGTYATMPTPSSFTINAQDLDAESFRSKVSGNLIRAVVSKAWVSISFSYNYLSESEASSLLANLLYSPMYIRIKSPVLGNTAQEYQMYCAKKDLTMVQDQRSALDDNVHYKLNFNIIQTSKVTGQ